MTKGCVLPLRPCCTWRPFANPKCWTIQPIPAHPRNTFRCADAQGALGGRAASTRARGLALGLALAWRPTVRRSAPRERAARPPLGTSPAAGTRPCGAARHLFSPGAPHTLRSSLSLLTGATPAIPCQPTAMAPFPLCCVAGLASAESVATLAAAATGLAAGRALGAVESASDFKGGWAWQGACCCYRRCCRGAKPPQHRCWDAPRAPATRPTPSAAPPTHADANAPLAGLLADHKKIVARGNRVTRPLVMLGAAAAAASAATHRDKHAAAPLAVAAASSAVAILISLTLVKRLEADIEVRRWACCAVHAALGTRACSGAPRSYLAPTTHPTTPRTPPPLTTTTTTPHHHTPQALPPTNASPSKKDTKTAAAEGQARELLQKWARLHSVRAALVGFAFGSTLCGVLLLNKKH